MLMGILNRTPDSFSDGGRFQSDEAALARVDAMVAEGASIIDIGAESTRPGSEPIDDDEQIRRLGEIVAKAVARGAIVSIDTTRARVAEYALREGARVINTVSLEPAAELGALAARYDASLVLMHSRGSMSTMVGFSVYADNAYDDVVSDVIREWSEAAARAEAAGLAREEIVFDPGLGFAKNARQSLELCARLEKLTALGYPVLVGPSRKSFVARAAAGEGKAIAPPEERLGGTIAAVLACAEKGAAIARVHDVAPVKQALAVAAALRAAARADAAGGAHA